MTTFFLEPLHDRGLTGRQNAGLHLVDPDRLRHCPCGDFVVSRQHHHAKTGGAKLLDGVLRRRLQRVGDAERTAQLTVDDDEDHRLPLSAKSVCFLRVRRTCPFRRKEARVADRDSLTVHTSDDALTA